MKCYAGDMFRLKKTLEVSRLSSKLSLVKALGTQSSIQSTSRVSFSPIPAAELKQTHLNPLAGRKCLAGSWSQTFPKYLANPREDFPHALQLEYNDKANFKELGNLSREKLDANLPRAGAVLFRRTGIQSSQDFKEFIQGIGYETLKYEGGVGNRSEVDSQIFSSTDDPPEHNIELHNEMSGTPYYAKKVIFCCLQPPKPNCGGLTPISKNSEIFKSLDPDVVDIIKKRKIRYLRYLPDSKDNPYMSWQQSFVTEDKKLSQFTLRLRKILQFSGSGNSIRTRKVTRVREYEIQTFENSEPYKRIKNGLHSRVKKPSLTRRAISNRHSLRAMISRHCSYPLIFYKLKVAEEFLQNAGINFEWIDSTCLCLWHVLDPIAPHVVTGQPVWFNQMESHHNSCLKESPMYQGLDLPTHMYAFHTQFGDGQEINSEILDHVRSVNWSKAVGFDWQEGDVIVMDNMAVMHSRLSFSGPRKIVVSLHN
ncbi:Clavaminate synthase-like protein [Exaiptasia diaphana]|nr:Clavaminate synthase-like protein [Exaiptasia diaphana]